MVSATIFVTIILLQSICFFDSSYGKMDIVEGPGGDLKNTNIDGPLKSRVVVVHNNVVPVPVECFQPPDSGSCAKDMVRIYYDHETRTCKPFSYTGCSGNANRFLSVKNCYRICHPFRYQAKVTPAVSKKTMYPVETVHNVPVVQQLEVKRTGYAVVSN